MKQLYTWLTTHLQAWHGTLLFVVLIATEGFLVLPVSALIAFFCLQNRQKAFMYAVLATSVTGLGALAGYGIGYLLHQTGNLLLLDYFVTPETMNHFAEQFETYQTFTSFAVALSPLPYRTLTISAGFLGVPLFPLIPLSIAARGVRFFAIAGVIYCWGDSFKLILDRYFYWLVCLGLLLGTLAWFIFR